jgi:hypothetical protein
MLVPQKPRAEITDGLRQQGRDDVERGRRWRWRRAGEAGRGGVEGDAAAAALGLGTEILW